MLRYYYLTWFSQPAADRPLYKLVSKQPIRSIVEIGVGQGVRTRRLFELAVKPVHAAEPLRYTGIDLFEARHAEVPPALSLKQAHSQLKTDHVQLQLVPGDPLMALSRAANSLAGTDLLIISLDQHSPALQQAWRFVPRMLHAKSLVYVEHPGKKSGETKCELLSLDEVHRLAAEAQRATRRAA
jgi:hypothetical protein